MLGWNAQARISGASRVPLGPVRPRYPGSVPRRGPPMILTPNRQITAAGSSQRRNKNRCRRLAAR
jgi:hypothetical protein